MPQHYREQVSVSPLLHHYKPDAHTKVSVSRKHPVSLSLFIYISISPSRPRLCPALCCAHSLIMPWQGIACLEGLQSPNLLSKLICEARLFVLKGATRLDAPMERMQCHGKSLQKDRTLHQRPSRSWIYPRNAAPITSNKNAVRAMAHTTGQHWQKWHLRSDS